MQLKLTGSYTGMRLAKSLDHCFVLLFVVIWIFSQVGISARSQIHGEEQQRATFRFNVSVADNLEPYRSLVLEHQQKEANGKRIA